MVKDTILWQMNLSLPTGAQQEEIDRRIKAVYRFSGTQVYGEPHSHINRISWGKWETTVKAPTLNTHGNHHHLQWRQTDYLVRQPCSHSGYDYVLRNYTKKDRHSFGIINIPVSTCESTTHSMCIMDEFNAYLTYWECCISFTHHWSWCWITKCSIASSVECFLEETSSRYILWEKEA